MDVDKFRKFFYNGYQQPPVLYVEGRQFQIDTYYLKTTPEDYCSATVAAIAQVHQEQPNTSESILAFLTGQDEIEATIKKLKQLFPNEMLLLPLYAALPSWAQARVFNKVDGKLRKVVISTNIAETSVTVPDKACYRL